jgi:hypothetical protein
MKNITMISRGMTNTTGTIRAAERIHDSTSKLSMTRSNYYCLDHETKSFVKFNHVITQDVKE